jgi:N,N'-diacetylchitobiose phosphorylase
MPAAMNKKAEIREIEPYVYCQSTHSRYSPRYGASRLPWLSGAATWAYYAATQYILGIQTDYKGLKIDPCIPAEWDKFNVTRRFRSKVLDIEVINESHKEKGVSKLILNDEELEGNFMPFGKMLEYNTVKVIM